MEAFELSKQLWSSEPSRARPSSLASPLGGRGVEQAATSASALTPSHEERCIVARMIARRAAPQTDIEAAIASDDRETRIDTQARASAPPSAMNAAADTLLRECRAQKGNAPSEALREAARAFVKEALRSSEPLEAVASALATESPSCVSWLAIVLGSAAESGADPSVAGERLFAAFEKLAKVVRDGSKRAQDEAIDVIPRCAQGAVAHLARLPALREKLGANEALLDDLRATEAGSPAAAWVRAALECVSGPLIVLHPLSARGAALRVENVTNCFHLFTLIQCAIGAKIEGGREVRKVIADCAHGRVDAATDDQAFWHYGDPRSSKPEIGASIRGEASVRSIPEIDGTRVLLLWPPLVGARFWDSSFFGPFLDPMPADVVFERMLTDEETRAWMARLGLDGRGQN